MEIAVISTSAPTLNLRFYNGVLQQEYDIYTYKLGLLETLTKEWRDVVSITTMKDFKDVK